jgi:hypothetical protein
MSSTINASTASGGGVITSADASGILQLQTAGVTAVTIDASQNIAFAKVPANTTPQSMVRLHTALGYGSTNTMIRRFTNTVTNQGSDITYADSATLGATFTINTNGVYAVSYNDQFSTSAWLGLSLNSTQLTTFIYSITTADILSITYGTNASGSMLTQWTGYLPAGSVVRAHTDNKVSGVTTSCCQFTIVRVA